jgi:hypothetical protein
MLAGSLLLAWIILTVLHLGRQLASAEHTSDQLYRQVQALGGTPVAGPPGMRGDPGPAGTPGRDAPTPDVTEIARLAALQVAPSPGPSGPSGPAGSPGPSSTVPGPSGAPGRPGADSTVPGPSGAVGPTGAPGPAGPNGQPGRDGQPPASWTFTYGGVQYTCTRATPFDPSNPRYQCEPAPAATPEPSTPPPLLQASRGR